MPVYDAPIEDMRFVLHHVVGMVDKLKDLPGGGDLSEDLVDAVLEEASKICTGVLQPLNQSGHEQGCRLENGAVRTPDGFADAYKAYQKGGWCGLSSKEEDGGQGLPKALNAMVDEMVSGANVSFGLYPSLTLGAYRALKEHGSQDLKAVYLPKMATGEWAGTMCLTESHAGSDLGLLRTKAEPAGDGSYRITGSKIFISGGDHDLTENIVHLVLARLPDAPPGTKGISLFLVPKRPVNEDGSLGDSNGVSVGSIEHKMGLNGSATCVMNFDGATGWLVGAPHRGLNCMFTMMNAERLFVGLQGLGLADAAMQNALAYAGERLQGRSPSGSGGRAADPILLHPDIRLKLLTTKAFVEGARALAAEVGLAIDITERHPDPGVRDEATDRIALLTPVIKAAFTDMAVTHCSECLQVLGGHGYVREWGMEQFLRDARITPIYEGTNGIQALDLVGRKLPLKSGGVVLAFFADILEASGAPDVDPVLADALRGSVLSLRDRTRDLLEAMPKDPLLGNAVATDYLRAFSLVALGWMWTRMDAVAAAMPNDPRSQDKRETARVFALRFLPEVPMLLQRVSQGNAPAALLRTWSAA